MGKPSKKTSKDMRLKANNPLAGTGQPAQPTATRPPKTHAQLKAVQEKKGEK